MILKYTMHVPRESMSIECTLGGANSSEEAPTTSHLALTVVLNNAQLQYCTLTARWLAVGTPSKEFLPQNHLIYIRMGVYTFMRVFKVASTRRTLFLITSHQIGKFCFSLFSIFQLNLIYTKEVITSMFIFLRSFLISHVILT